MKFESLNEASHIGAFPSDVSRQLVILPFPEGLDSELFSDWDHQVGVGGVDSIILENPHVLITSKEFAADYAKLLADAAKFFSR